MTDSALDLLFELRAARGDVKAARYVQERHPEKSGISVDLGDLNTPQGLAEAQRRILKAVAEGKISAHDGQKMSAQLEDIGNAYERSELAHQIDKLQQTINSTKEAKASISIHKKLEILSLSVLNYCQNKEQSWNEYYKRHGDDTASVYMTTIMLGYFSIFCGMESDAFLRSGIRRLLPKSLQELFDFIYPDRRNEILKRNEGQTAYSRRSRSERWIPDGWICSCKNKTTLWIETQVAVSDRLQIYCEGCHNLVGWGTDDEFDKAHEECLASWVEHSETEIVKKFDPPPAIGMTAYLRNHMDDFSYLFKDAS